jgi:hypothetical protein
MTIERPMFPPTAEREPVSAKGLPAPMARRGFLRGLAQLAPTVALTAAAAPSAAASPPVLENPRASRPDLAARLDDLYSRYKQQWERDAAGCDDDDPELERWEALSAEGAILFKLIINEPAVTIADIVLQARACALENSEFWISVPEWINFGAVCNRLLIDRICEFAGTTAFPGVHVDPLPSKQSATEGSAV